jgi:hypothetical protein
MTNVDIKSQSDEYLEMVGVLSTRMNQGFDSVKR